MYRCKFLLYSLFIVLEDGSREQKILKGFVTRGTEGNIIIQFDEEEDIKTYLENKVVNMEPFNQMNNYQLQIPETNYENESNLQCYGYELINGASGQMPTIPIYHQQPPRQQQQPAVYFPARYEDCTINQNDTQYETIYIYVQQEGQESQEPVPVSIVPVQQQRMSVIRPNPVSNHNVNNFQVESPVNGNFSMRADGEIVGPSMMTPNNMPPKPKPKRTPKPKAPPKSKNVIQNLNNTSMSYAGPNPNSINDDDIPFVGFPHQSDSPILKTAMLPNSLMKKVTSSVHLDSVINSVASAANIDPDTSIGSINQSNVTSYFSVLTPNSRKQPTLVKINTPAPGTSTVNNEPAQQIQVVVEKPVCI